MKWIGLTGGIASGKSTVAKLLAQRNIAIIDADQLAHLALEPGQKPYLDVINIFGSQIKNPDEKIDRRKLGEIVFKDKEKLRKLEALIHPFVQDRAALMRKQFQDQGHGFAVYDVPLLFEKSLQKNFDRVVVVYSSEQQQIQRMKRRNQLTEQECLDRLSAQVPIEDKKKLADDVILNTSDLETLEKNVDQWLKNIRALLKVNTCNQ